MNQEEIYMKRCIQLARNGQNTTSPNPMVGAVIVCDGKIIGEGYHIRCGGPHAEVHAIRSVKDQELLKRSTIYVSLEPCSHYGKTPPCADLIIEKQIPRVVIGCMDPFAKVAGRGIQKLQNAGIDVTVGVCEEECKELNKRFFTFHQKKRPFITLKWAQSANGFLDGKRSPDDGKTAIRFSNPESMTDVHKLRSCHEAILVGYKTALLDDPKLNVRLWTGKNPIRIVIDPLNELPENLQLFTDGGQTRHYTTTETCRHPESANDTVTSIRLEKDLPLLPQIMSDLYQCGIQSLLVEGGARTLHEFIQADLWDTIRIEQAPMLLGTGIPAPALSLGTDKNLKIGTKQIGGNTITYISRPFI